MSGPLRSGVQRTVELLDPQEAWVQQLLTANVELTFADVVRWCVARTMEQFEDVEAAAAVVPHREWKPGPEPGYRAKVRTSSWPRVKTCVGCGTKGVEVRLCCDHVDAKPTCPACYKNEKGNHGEHGSYRRDDDD